MKVITTNEKFMILTKDGLKEARINEKVELVLQEDDN